MSVLECEVCGLAACDLPDGVDPELIFEDGLCQLCERPPVDLPETMFRTTDFDDSVDEPLKQATFTPLDEDAEEDYL